MLVGSRWWEALMGSAVAGDVEMEQIFALANAVVAIAVTMKSEHALHHR